VYNPNITPRTAEVDAVPKINVYLPEDLAEAVREARLPVSAVCQRALEDALRHTTAASESARSFADANDASVWVRGRATPRVHEVMRLAHQAARARKVGYVGTEHVLIGLLDEGGNLGLRVIESLDVEVDDLRQELDAAIEQHTPKRSSTTRLPVATPTMNEVFDIAAKEALRLGHNYIGCEHVLLGLVIDEEGLAGRVLRSMGLEVTVTRRAVVTALSGFLHARENKPLAESAAPSDNTIERALDEIRARLTEIEAKLAS
jgi:ATP-dependent Clp protease ATP-binding subunit ClpC